MYNFTLFSREVLSMIIFVIIFTLCFPLSSEGENDTVGGREASRYTLSFISFTFPSVSRPHILACLIQDIKTFLRCSGRFPMYTEQNRTYIHTSQPLQVTFSFPPFSFR